MSASYRRRLSEIAGLERANERLRYQTLVMANAIIKKTHGPETMRVANEVCGIMTPRKYEQLAAFPVKTQFKAARQGR